MKDWDWAGVKLTTPGSAVRLATTCATRSRALTHYLLVPSADNPCKQVGPR